MQAREAPASYRRPDLTRRHSQKPPEFSTSGCIGDGGNERTKMPFASTLPIFTSSFLQLANKQPFPKSNPSNPNSSDGMSCSSTLVAYSPSNGPAQGLAIDLILDPAC